MSGETPLRVAFIGCGNIATRQHGPAFQTIPGVTIVAGCDLLPERAQAFTARFGGRPYTDLTTMLAVEQPDIVVVCTREDQHVEPTLAALEAGAHVLCEKIMAHTLAGGQAMLMAARRTGRLLGINYNYRFFPPLVTLKRLLTEGALGEIAFLSVTAHAFCFHHALDLLRWLGGDVVALTGQVSVAADPQVHYPVRCPDFVYVPSRAASVVVRFASGALGTLTATRYEHLTTRLLQLEVAGARGRLVVDGLTLDDIVGRLTRWPEGQEIPTGAGPERGFALSFQQADRAFVARVRGAETPAATGEDGYAVLLLERALVLAQTTGRTIALPSLTPVAEVGR